MKLSAKKTVVAKPLLREINLQLFAEEGGAPAGNADDVGGGSAGNASAIINDPYASGGPEPPENFSPESVDLEGFDFDSEDEEPAAAESSGSTESEESTESMPEPVKKEQSPEANAAFAEMRRQAEQARKQAERAQQQLAERDAWISQTFGATHNLHTWEQYQKAVEETNRQQAMQLQQAIQSRPVQVAQQTYQQLIQAGYDEGVAREIANTKAAAETVKLQNQALLSRLTAIENQGRQQQEAFRQAAILQQQEVVKKQILDSLTADHKQLQQEYGDLIPADPEQFFGGLDDTIKEKLQKGYSLYDAWCTTNRAKIAEQSKKAAAQKTLNNLSSKKHLKTEGDGAGDSDVSSVPLSPETLAMYIDSGMTEKQARAFHKKIYS